MRVVLNGWKTIMRLGPKGVLEKVWEPNRQIRCSRSGWTSDVSKKKISLNKCELANIFIDKNRP
jgi:hypothetical protein